MKRLKLPKNKYLRLLINIIFVIVWYLIASQIKWQLNGLRFFPYIYPWEVGWILWEEDVSLMKYADYLALFIT